MQHPITREIMSITVVATANVGGPGVWDRFVDE